MMDEYRVAIACAESIVDLVLAVRPPRPGSAVKLAFETHIRPVILDWYEITKSDEPTVTHDILLVLINIISELGIDTDRLHSERGSIVLGLAATIFSMETATALIPREVSQLTISFPGLK